MKIRQGFVSNSSSSSFLIYGTTINETQSKKIDEATSELEQEYPNDDEIYCGISWSQVKDDETGKQFKERVENEFKKLFPKTKFEFDTHSASWYS